eukprot:135734-Amorphochlora_amoeboformis.AAC.1
MERTLSREYKAEQGCWTSFYNEQISEKEGLSKSGGDEYGSADHFDLHANGVITENGGEWICQRLVSWGMCVLDY